MSKPKLNEKVLKALADENIPAFVGSLLIDYKKNAFAFKGMQTNSKKRAV